MNISTTIPPTVQIRRSRLLGLVGGAAAVAAAVTWAVAAYGLDSRTGQAQTSALAQPAVASSSIPMARSLDGKHADFWNYGSGMKVANTSPGVLPEDLATLFAGSPSVVEQPIIVSSPIPISGYLDGISGHPTVATDPAIVSSPIPMSGYLDGITSHPSVVAGPAGAP